MTPPSAPHDALFRALLDDPVRVAAVLQEYLPAEVVPLLDGALPEPVDGSFIDESLVSTQSDRLFKVGTRDGRSAFVYTLLEHKSTADPATPIQLGTYLMRIWRRNGAGPNGDYRRLPPIIPMVIYHGRHPWSVPTAISDCLDAEASLKEHLRDLRYTVHHLDKRPDAALSGHPDVEAVFLALKHLRDGQAPFEMLIRILQRPSSDPRLLKQLIHYILATQSSIDRHHWHRLVAAARPGEEEEVMSIAIQQWQEEGRLKGLAEGMAKGMAEGKADSLIRILELRFGPVEQTLQQQIRSQSAEALSAAVDRAVAAPTLAEALDDLDQH